MSENTNTTIDNKPEWHESFPEPTTFPEGWDVSAVEAEEVKFDSVESEG